MSFLDYVSIYKDIFIPTYLALVSAGVTLFFLYRMFVGKAKTPRRQRATIELPEPLPVARVVEEEDEPDKPQTFDPSRMKVK